MPDNTPTITSSPRTPHDISGSGGKGGGQERHYYRQPDTIRSTGTVRALCVLSAGPIEGLAKGNQSLLLDGTPYANADGSINVEGVTWQVTTGGQDQTPITHDGFNGVERADSVAQTLLPSQPIIRTGRGDAARITIRFPTGLLQQTDYGIYAASLRIKIEKKLASSQAWQLVRTDTITEKQSALFEKQYLIPAPAAPQTSTGDRPRFSIRVTRLTAAGDDTSVRDRVDWGVVTWITHDQLSYAGLSLLAITASAEGMSGRLPRLAVAIKGRLVEVPSNYTPTTRTYTGVWDGQFILRWSNNPAWVLYDLLTDRHWGLGIRPAAIDRYDFYALARYADEMVEDGAGGREPRFLFDGVIRRRESAAALIGRICAAVHAVVFWSGGQLRCMVDKPSDAVLRLTNAHVEDGHFVYSTATRQAGFSHAVVSFADPDSHDGVGVEAETSQALFARYGFRQHEVQLIGCQRRSQARRHARWLLETAEAGLHSISWRASLDHFADNPIRPGDVVAIYDGNRLPTTTIPFRLSLDRGGKALWVMRPIAGAFPAGARLKLRYETAQGWDEVAITATDTSTDNTTNSDDAGITRSKLVPKPKAGFPTPPLPHGVGLVWDSSDSTNAATAPLYRIVSLREIDRARVEVDAVLHDVSKYGRIDSSAASLATRRQPSIDFTTPLPKATALVASQLRFGSGRDVQLSWTQGLDARIAEWHIEAHGPNAERHALRVATPPAVITEASAGDWRFDVRAVDWTGRRGGSTSITQTITADAITPATPSSVRAIAGFGQLAIVWVHAATTPHAEIEIWEYTSAADTAGTKAATIASSQEAWISLDRTAGTTGYFRVRTRLSGGTLSPFSRLVSASVLALPRDGTDGNDGNDGADGRDGNDGADGRDGTDGTDGRDGRDGSDGDAGTRGSIIASKQISQAVWQNREALAAITLLVAGGAVAGDLVTLWRETPTPWAETRRYTGSIWQKTDTVISGDQVAKKSIAANRLLIADTSLTEDSATGALKIGNLTANHITSGSLQSTNYQADADGFRVDMTGRAEFNDATIRGVLLGGRIEGTTLVSSIDTTPTEAGKPYVTHSIPRRLTYQIRQQSGHTLTIGPLIVARDAASRRLNDGRNVVIAYDDPHGAVAGEALNPNFSRFWARSPFFAVTVTMTRSGTPWGQNITGGQVQITLETESGRQLAQSSVRDLSRASRWRDASQDVALSYSLNPLSGFVIGSRASISRSVTRETSGARRSFTSSISMRFEMGCPFSYQAGTTTGDGLRVKLLANFATAGLSIDVTRAFYNNIRIEGATID